jgi:hypothetical protein
MQAEINEEERSKKTRQPYHWRNLGSRSNHEPNNTLTIREYISESQNHKHGERESLAHLSPEELGHPKRTTTMKAPTK